MQLTKESTNHVIIRQTRTTIKTAWLLLLAACILQGHIAQGEPYDWYWDSPRKPVNTIISKAEGKHILSVNIALTNTGELVAFNEHSLYGGDTNVTNASIQWHRSVDGGLTWARHERPLGFQEVESGFSAPPIKMADGTLLTVGSNGWENHPNTRSNREKFGAKKLYLYIHGVNKNKNDSSYTRQLDEPHTLLRGETFVLSATVQCAGEGAVTVFMQGPDGGASMNGWRSPGGRDGGVSCVGRDREGVALSKFEIKVPSTPIAPTRLRMEINAIGSKLFFAKNSGPWMDAGSSPHVVSTVDRICLHCYNHTQPAPLIDSLRLAVRSKTGVERTLFAEDFEAEAGTDLSKTGWRHERGSPWRIREAKIDKSRSAGSDEAKDFGVISLSYSEWMKRSCDGGRTWRKSDIAFQRSTPHLACYGDPILTKSGTFLQPMWGRFDMKKEPTYVSSLAARTTDSGDTWSIHRIAMTPEFDFNETSVTQTPNGDIVALMRTTDQRELWTAVSQDDGVTWSEPRDSGLRGSTPAVVTSKDGLVVAVYCRRNTSTGGGGFKKTGVMACVSRDNGQTWDTDHQVMIHVRGTGFVGGYPKAKALPDGSVYAVYLFNGISDMCGTRFHPLHPDFGNPTTKQQQQTEEPRQ